jgi:hypothetical protein
MLLAVKLQVNALFARVLVQKYTVKYHRVIGDLPISGKIATINLQVRKFFCENSDCIRKIFSERFKQQLQSYARRFERLNEYCGETGSSSILVKDHDLA